MKLLYFKMQFNLLSAIYNQNFNSYLLFNKKDISNKYVINNTNDVTEGKLLTFSLVDDSSGELIQGTYNPANAKIATPNDIAGMIYGEIESTNTKFIISNGIEYSQNFSDYDIIYSIETNYPTDESPSTLGATGYFIISKTLINPYGKSEIFWGYMLSNDSEGAFANSRYLKTVIIDKKINRIYRGTFGNCIWLTTVSMSDNINEIEDDAFINCISVNKVNILIVNDNQENIINNIKKQFPITQLITYEIYEE